MRASIPTKHQCLGSSSFQLGHQHERKMVACAGRKWGQAGGLVTQRSGMGRLHGSEGGAEAAGLLEAGMPWPRAAGSAFGAAGRNQRPLRQETGPRERGVTFL